MYLNNGRRVVLVCEHGAESRGGGGTLDIYWWGCAAAHPKRGVLGTGTTQKGGS